SRCEEALLELGDRRPTNSASNVTPAAARTMNATLRIVRLLSLDGRSGSGGWPSLVGAHSPGPPRRFRPPERSRYDPDRPPCGRSVTVPGTRTGPFGPQPPSSLFAESTRFRCSFVTKLLTSVTVPGTGHGRNGRGRIRR